MKARWEKRWLGRICRDSNDVSRKSHKNSTSGDRIQMVIINLQTTALVKHETLMGIFTIMWGEVPINN